MLSTLKEAMKTLKTTQPLQKRKKSVSDGMLGKYADILPKEKMSAQFVREQRASAYGKVKK
ncbi:MAG: hypothetical protein M0R70_08135 [Nitrospirae bacterium]|nr:hypothetical protein [Nitrospirota bacterium]